MGYFTKYSLDTNCPDGHRDALHACLMSIEDAPYALRTVECGLIYEYEQPCKWYNVIEDFCKLSLLFHGVTFTLSGTGEQQGDVWRKIFLNGKYKDIWPCLQWPDEKSIEQLPWQKLNND